jgi:hypothetical protein
MTGRPCLHRGTDRREPLPGKALRAVMSAQCRVADKGQPEHKTMRITEEKRSINKCNCNLVGPEIVLLCTSELI